MDRTDSGPRLRYPGLNSSELALKIFKRFLEVYKMEKVITAKKFWDIYSSELNKNTKGKWDAYHNDTSWTSVIKQIAINTCRELKLQPSTEYYRVDVIGYRWEEPQIKGNWWLDVAYEHENSDNWWDELCKLCYVAADLRVISSYYKLGAEVQSVEDKIREYLERLGKEKIFRVTNSEWLFVFGPRLVSADQPFRAFTVDDQLSVIPVTGGERVVPEEWKKQNT